jgi:hypothetical protein
MVLVPYPTVIILQPPQNPGSGGKQQTDGSMPGEPA